MSGTPEKIRLDPLTSLRFFAAAMIVMHHAVDRGFAPTWASQLALGQGVSFFFVLSGFVLAYNYPNLSTRGAIATFYVARLARIWPLHIATLGLYTALISNVSYFYLPQDSRAFITLAYVTLTHAWIPVWEFATAYNTVSWSISTEFFFYLSFPLLAHNWRRTWRLKLLLVLGIAIAMWILATKVAGAQNENEMTRGLLSYINPLARLFEFTIGIGICHLFTNHAKRIQTACSPSVASAVEIGALALVLVNLHLSHVLAGSPAVSAALTATGTHLLKTSGFGTVIFALAILIFAMGLGTVSKFLRLRPMVFLGEISFSLYMVHSLFLLYRQQAPTLFADLSDGTTLALYWSAALVLATALHFGVELPCQTLIKAWYSRASPPAGTRPERAIGIFVLFVGCIVLLQPSVRQPYPGAPSAIQTALLKEAVVFSPSYRLDAIELLRTGAGHEPALRFAWHAENDVSLAKRIAVHLLDDAGKMVHQLDFAMETGYRTAYQGEQWSNLLPLAGIDMTQVRALGIAVYDGLEMQFLAPPSRANSDWGGQRLLVRLP